MKNRYLGRLNINLHVVRYLLIIIRGAIIQGGRIFEGGDYSRGAFIRGGRLFKGGDFRWGGLLFKEIRYMNMST